MPLWKVEPVDQDPHIILRSWSIRQLANGDRHFVGYNDRGREGRVSSRIVEFDVERMRGKTRSGRVYELSGEPGMNGDAEYVWNSWCSMFGVDHGSVVTVPPEEIKAPVLNDASPKTPASR